MIIAMSMRIINYDFVEIKICIFIIKNHFCIFL